MKRIAVFHNYYQQAGGEDQVFADEQELLRAHGHDVFPFTVDNEQIDSMSKVALVRATFWNAQIRKDVDRLLTTTRADIAHFHNTFPLLSPAAYDAARRRRVGVVQTLHNFRLLCPNALLFREGRTCEECVGRHFAWPGVQHGCYRGSRTASAVTATMVAAHRTLGTWDKSVNVYVALSAFARDRFVEGGLPADRILVKPNFAAKDPGVGDHRGAFALFVGRLSEEKGIRLILDAWHLCSPKIPLRIVGTGPLENLRTSSPPGVEWLGWQGKENVIELMKAARVLIVPSLCFENFPMSIVEAYATGLPVIASAHGSLAEIVEHDCTGWHTQVGSATDLVAQVEKAFSNDREYDAISAEARCRYETRYSADSNYSRLREIYTMAHECATAA